MLTEGGRLSYVGDEGRLGPRKVGQCRRGRRFSFLKKNLLTYYIIAYTLGIIAVVGTHNLLILLTNLMRSNRISDGGGIYFFPRSSFHRRSFGFVHYVLYIVFSWIGSVWENWIFIPRSNIRFEGFAVFEMAHFSSQSKRVLYTLCGNVRIGSKSDRVSISRKYLISCMFFDIEFDLFYYR